MAVAAAAASTAERRPWAGPTPRPRVSMVLIRVSIVGRPPSHSAIARPTGRHPGPCPPRISLRLGSSAGPAEPSPRRSDRVSDGSELGGSQSTLKSLSCHTDSTSKLSDLPLALYVDRVAKPSWLKAKAVSRPIWSGRHGFNSCPPQQPEEACFVLSTKQYA